ncbi:hypothetical protein R3P38DRAFT_3378759 [Favolaschia claudopus]|uniref:Gustatory receptor n=1 Tax=Favolaschia claudopus TaxID=2862362 RepID=A0AAV9Z737_9AGAR
MSSLSMQFVGYWLETLFYGIYLTTCVSCIRALLLIHTGSEVRWRTRTEVKWFFLVIGTLLFMVSMFEIIVGLLVTMQLFVGGNARQNVPPDGSSAFKLYTIASSNPSRWVTIVTIAPQIIQSLLGDLVLVRLCLLSSLFGLDTALQVHRFISHQFHIVDLTCKYPRFLIFYGRCWTIVLPSVLLYIADVALAVAFIVGTILAADGSRGAALATLPWLWYFVVTFFAVAAFQNILTTWLLIRRIWKVDQQARKVGGISQPASQRSLRHVIRILAECGLCYTAMIVLTLVVSLFPNNAIYPISDVTLLAAGIAFNFIIMQTAPSVERTTLLSEDGRSPRIELSSEAAAGSEGMCPVILSMLYVASKRVDWTVKFLVAFDPNADGGRLPK